MFLHIGNMPLQGLISHTDALMLPLLQIGSIFCTLNVPSLKPVSISELYIFCAKGSDENS